MQVYFLICELAEADEALLSLSDELELADFVPEAVAALLDADVDWDGEEDEDDEEGCDEDADDDFRYDLLGESAAVCWACEDALWLADAEPLVWVADELVAFEGYNA